MYHGTTGHTIHRIIWHHSGTTHTSHVHLLCKPIRSATHNYLEVLCGCLQTPRYSARYSQYPDQLSKLAHQNQDTLHMYTCTQGFCTRKAWLYVLRIMYMHSTQQAMNCMCSATHRTPHTTHTHTHTTHTHTHTHIHPHPHPTTQPDPHTHTNTHTHCTLTPSWYYSTA